ncbi:hypothetical protein UlMin_006104 [Ulmus minor]
MEQLKAVKEQTDVEVNLLQDSLNNICTATARLKIGKKMLVPLTASLYIAETLYDADNVLVDVGTGYFIEQFSLTHFLHIILLYFLTFFDVVVCLLCTLENNGERKDYCERKINLLRSNFDQLVELIHLCMPFQVVVATETGGALGGMVKQLSIDQFQNKGKRVSYGTPESSTTTRKLIDQQMSINNVPKKVF